MSYQPLARKYRPSGFEDLVGQDSVAKALANGIRLGREPHAVIFSGVRGIGKTTAARLYAKALNCESGPTPNPCGTCSSCLAVANCTHEDVMEIDGASNTSVDDIRQLRETVDYVPQRSRFKIYIIDEVHMLSNSAFNALLKTLEEPPPSVVFLFATTELQKIPQTIIGRCQTFYLRKFSVEQIAGRLHFVLKSEGIKAEDRVVTEIAKRGNGSMRDALTFLDTAIAVSDGELTLDRIADLLNCVSSDLLISLLESLLSRNGSQILTLIDRLDQQGVAFDELIEQLAEFARHAFILRDFGTDAKLVSRLSLDQDLLNQLKKVASQASALDLNRIFRTLMQCRVELDGSSLDRYVVENYCLEWCLDPGLPDIETLKSWSKNQRSTPLEQRSAPLENTNRTQLPEMTKAIAKEETNKPETQKAEPPRTEPRRDLRESWLKRDAEPKAMEPSSSSTAENVSSTASVESAPIAEPIAETHRETDETTEPDPQTQLFPNSWRELVDEWQKKKPLQARIFEETYSVTFNPNQIIIAVNRDTLAGMKLLNRDIQTKVLQQMRELFDFTGQLTVLDRQDSEAASHASINLNDGTESVLDTKRREKILRRDEIRQELENSPATKSLLDVFGGRIESIEVIDPG